MGFLNFLDPSLTGGERYLVFPTDELLLWPYAAAAAVLTVLVVTRRYWAPALRRAWHRLRGPQLTGPERSRYESTCAAIDELLRITGNGRVVRPELDGPLVAYRRALHRHAQLRRYLGFGNFDLETTVRELEDKHKNGSSRRVDAALGAAKVRLRARGRALEELDNLQLELVHLENRMWATIESHIARDAAGDQHDLHELLNRLKADEETRAELFVLEQGYE